MSAPSTAASRLVVLVTGTVDSELLGDAVEDAADPVEARLVDVVEGDLVVLGRDLAGGEGSIDHRGPEASGTDQGQLHARIEPNLNH